MTGFAEFDVAVEQLLFRCPDPNGLEQNWVEQLRWGLDSVATSTRFLLCAQMIGSCVVARTQLERWSTNLAANIGASQRADENSVDWLRRVWAVKGAQSLLTWRSEKSTDIPVPGPFPRQIDAGRSFICMSELLHGRGPLMDVVWWESADVTAPLGAEIVAAIDIITDALLLCVRRIQSGLATAAEDSGKSSQAEKLWQTAIAGPLHGQIQSLDPLLFPVDSNILRDRKMLEKFSAPGAYYRSRIKDARRSGSAAIQEELGPVLAFADRRSQALSRASMALKEEEIALADEFDIDQLDTLAMQALLSTEMAAVLALWLRDRGRQEAASALVTCSTAMRSAVWLWLEDDDRAMGCLRVVIEQLARARTWRIKSSSAIKLEARPETTPRDWVEKCGWRRLGILLRALGEFAHGANPTHWSTARDVLIALNPNPDRDIAKKSGRTKSLENLVVVLNSECEAWLAEFDPVLAEAFWDVTGRTRNNLDAELDSNMQHSWLHRHLATRTQS